MNDVVIIGSGPAGVSAAIYTARAGLSTCVFGDPAGGHLYQSHLIANYFGFPDDISGPDLALRGVAQAKRFGAVFREHGIVDVRSSGKEFTVIDDTKTEYKSKTLIIASGMSYVSSGIAEEKKYVGRGVSYCATCDGAFYRDKRVVVIGSGSFAAEEALQVRMHTPHVTIVSQSPGWSISPELEKELAKAAITKRLGKGRAIESNADGFVAGVTFADGTSEHVDGIFVAIGTAGPANFASKLGLLTDGKFIKVDGSCRTSLDGVYAVGNCTGADAQVAVSVGMGCTAALAIVRRLRGQKVYVDYN